MVMMIPLTMRMCALRLLNVHMYFTIFFLIPPPSRYILYNFVKLYFEKYKIYILYNFILTSVENYFPKELGGGVPSDWLGGLTPVRLHGYYMDLSINTEQSNTGSQSFLSCVSDRRRCLCFHWKWLKNHKQRSVDC